MGQAAGGVTVTLKRAELKLLLERTQFAMAQQDVRYYLNGLLIDVSPKRLRAVATDGHRLAFSELTRDMGVTEVGCRRSCRASRSSS
jgi:DNA polymerase-3 subunit beta